MRNRAKIEATIALARIWLDLHGEARASPDYLWGFVDGRPIAAGAQDPRATCRSRRRAVAAMAKDLRARGVNFVGPTIVYAFMQATGMVNDHLVDCFRHEPCRALARDFPA